MIPFRHDTNGYPMSRIHLLVLQRRERLVCHRSSHSIRRRGRTSVPRNPNPIVVGSLSSIAVRLSRPISAESYVRVALAVEVVGPAVIKNLLTVFRHLQTTVSPTGKVDFKLPVRVLAFIDSAQVKLLAFAGIAMD